jgi:hypothetical protein
MADTYDVGGGNNDFPNPVSAANTLQSIGVTAPTTFNVYSGTYDGTINIPGTIYGMGASNPITFQNAPGEHPIITSSSSHGFYLTGADYITIQGFEITSCYNSAISSYHTGGADSSNYNNFIANYIHNVSLMGGHSGIGLRYNSHCQILENEIEGSYQGICDERGFDNLIANNMVYNISSRGIRTILSNYDNIVFNSVYISNSSEGVCLDTDTNILLNNNIFQQAGNGYAIAFYDDPSNYQSDYNILYAPNGFVGYYNGDLLTLADFQTATGLDLNSISADPHFIDSTNLHIDTTAASPASNAGIPITGITTDFDGDSRDPVTPDIGADEFDLAAPPPAVQDLVISMLDTMIYLQWTPASGALQYHIYKSTTNPDSGFSLFGSVADTFFVDIYGTSANNISFYYITSDNYPLDTNTAQCLPKLHMHKPKVEIE